MKITQEAIKEFTDLYQQENPGEQITSEELLDMATGVMALLEAIYKPIKK